MDNINFPNDHYVLRRIKEEFYEIARFPNVVGAIDGTLIPIMGMTGDEEPAFVCRKGFHALNVQAVVDANMRFALINTHKHATTMALHRAYQHACKHYAGSISNAEDFAKAQKIAVYACKRFHSLYGMCDYLFSEMNGPSIMQYAYGHV